LYLSREHFPPPFPQTLIVIFDRLGGFFFFFSFLAFKTKKSVMFIKELKT